MQQNFWDGTLVMATLDLVTQKNEKAGSVELDPAVFEAPVKPHLFHIEVRRQLARRRAGTHSTKNRARVSGGGSKPWRQKGTGRARQGTIRAAQWAGGGVVFGPVPRDYTHKVPKKVRRAALCGALSQQVGEGRVTVVDELLIDEFKTAKMAGILSDLGLRGESLLIVIAEANAHVEHSARNLPRVDVIRAEGLNVYDVLRHTRLLFTRAALQAVAQRLGLATGEEDAP